MDITIYTSDPNAVDIGEVKAAVESAGYFVLSITVNDGSDTVKAIGRPDTQTEPWCNHDLPALDEVTVWRCECGATIDPDSGDVIGEGETGPDAVALGLTEDTDTQTEPARALPKPGTEIRADQLATDNLVGLTIAHPDTDEPFTIARVDMHGDLVLLWSTDGGQTDIDPDSPVDVVEPKDADS